jgi:hypothetical protein
MDEGDEMEMLHMQRFSVSRNHDGAVARPRKMFIDLKVDG